MFPILSFDAGSGTAGRPAYVIGFAQRPKASTALGLFSISPASRSASPHVQGIAWISADQRPALRLRTDLLHPVPEIQLGREATEIDYRPYHFLSSPRTFCLPNRAMASVKSIRKRVWNEHIFSEFRLFKVGTETEGLIDARMQASESSISNR